MAANAFLRVSLAFGLAVASLAQNATCPGNFHVQGLGQVALVPTGWTGDRATGGDNVKLTGPHEITSFMDSRAYFAETCTAGEYDHTQYLKLDLLGKTLRYKTDLSGAGCGCNAAFYLTSMGHNEHKSECHDYYCDANNVCGESCAEIDIQEANQYAWHSTLHTAHDHQGQPSGYGGGGPGWNGPRNWTQEDFAPGGKCIDTNRPFDVAVSFPVNASGILEEMVLTLSQAGKACQLSTSVDKYAGNADLTKALKNGMTPIVSYWSSDDMLWMDGVGHDEQGPCARDNATKCGDSVKFYDFAITDIHPWQLRKAHDNIEAQAQRYSTVTTTTTTTTTTAKTWAWLVEEQPEWVQLTTTVQNKWWPPRRPHTESGHISAIVWKYRLSGVATAIGRWHPAAVAAVGLAVVVLGMAVMLLAVRGRRIRRATPPSSDANEAGEAGLRPRSSSRHASSCALMEMGGARDEDGGVV